LVVVVVVVVQQYVWWIRKRCIRFARRANKTTVDDLKFSFVRKSRNEIPSRDSFNNSNWNLQALLLTQYMVQWRNYTGIVGSERIFWKERSIWRRYEYV